MAGFLRDFKRFTSAKFKANLETTEPSVLKLFVDAPRQLPVLDGDEYPKENRKYSVLPSKIKLYPRESGAGRLRRPSRALAMVVG